jgi:hypothetical protein
MKPIRVYVAGPYTKGDVAVNVKRAMDMALELLDGGYAPYCPHLTHFLHIHYPHAYDEWLALDLEWLECCEAVVRLPGESAGADREVARAIELGLPVFSGYADLSAWRAESGRRPTRFSPGAGSCCRGRKREE